MKTLNQLSIVQETNANMPFGSTVQNETDTQEGTPIVREHYADILQNMYKLLKLAKITPTGTEDSNATQYQIVNALKKLPNSMNDIEQVLTLDGDTWSVPLDFTILPNKYFFFARPTDDYVNGVSYAFTGTTNDEFIFESSGFKSGDLLLVISDVSGVRAYLISSVNTPDQAFTSLGQPVAFNDSNKMWYQEGGKLISDVPSINDLEATLQDEYSEPTLILNEMFVFNGFVLCFCLIPGANNYFFRQFDLTDLTASTLVNLVGTSFDDSDNFLPYAYVLNGAVYITNAMNGNSNDYSFTKLNYDPSSPTLTFVSSFDLNTSFVKTTNAAIKSGLLYTMVSGEINSFNLTSGAKVSLGDYPIVAGQLFGFNGSIYFTSGEVAHKWF